MTSTTSARTVHARTRRGRAKGLLGAGLLAALTAALTVFVFAGTAFANTIDFTGQGTNKDGTCETFEGQPPAPGGTQTWQFNLTGTQPGATMSATFTNPSSSVTNKPEDDHNGNTSFWFITTAAGASLQSATATFTPVQNGNPQFVVSHCTAGGTPPTNPPPTTAPPTTTPSGGGGGAVSQPQAAVAVVSVPGFTG